MTVKSLAAAYARRFLTAVNDRSNPILVKEIRQSIHSNIFMVMFMFVLLVNIIICLVGTVNNMPIGPETSFGKEMFIGLCAAFAFVGFLFMPLLSMKEMERERTSYTFEMLRITNLSTYRIVNGKLLSAYVQLVLYMSAFFPFMMFTFLARGITIFQIITGFIYLSLIAIWMVMMGIVLGTLGKSRFLRSLGSLIGLGAFILFGSWGLGGLIATDFFSELQGDEWVIAVGLSLMHYFFTFGILYLAAVNQLSPYVTNCSRGFRLASLAYTAVSFTSLFAGKFLISVREYKAVGVVIIMANLIWWCVMFMFSSGEDVQVPMALRKKIPVRRPFLALQRLVIPGGTRGYRLSLYMILLVVTIGTLFANYNFSHDKEEFITVMVMLPSYVIFYVSMALIISRRLERVIEITPMKRRAISVILVGAVTVLTIVVHLFIIMLAERSYKYDDFMVLQAFNPIMGMAKGLDDGGPIVYAVICFAVLGVVMNVPWLRQGNSAFKKLIDARNAQRKEAEDKDTKDKDSIEDKEEDGGSGDS